MKIIISGKGGCGKSTVAAMIASALARRGNPVFLVDADESNFGLSRLLGAPQPVALMDHLGGKPGLKKKMGQAFSEKQPVAFLNQPVAASDIPPECISEAGGVKLLVMGKIHDFGEGCACPIGVLSKGFLSNFDPGEKAFVIVDAEAGVEHLGRRVDMGCDLILAVVDPTYESFLLVQKMDSMVQSAGMDIRFVLNKVTPEIHGAMSGRMDPAKIIGAIPLAPAVAAAGLEGGKLPAPPPEVDRICDFLTGYVLPQKPGRSILA